jgi:hypothetical protein
VNSKKTIEDLYEILAPNIEINTGSSGEELYGNYCEWQNLVEYDDETLNILQDYFLDKLPKTKYTKREDIISFLREQGVPEDMAYEFEENFPESQGYYTADETQYLYELYAVKYSQFVSEVNTLKTQIYNESNHLVIKALLFAVFSLAESYLKQVIWDQIPKIEENVNNESLRQLLKDYINDSLKYTEKTMVLCNKLSLNINKLPHSDLRNVLAHNIGDPEVIGFDIIYFQKNDTKMTKNIGVVINDLLEYAKNI